MLWKAVYETKLLFYLFYPHFKIKDNKRTKITLVLHWTQGTLKRNGLGGKYKHIKFFVDLSHEFKVCTGLFHLNLMSSSIKADNYFIQRSLQYQRKIRLTLFYKLIMWMSHRSSDVIFFYTHYPQHGIVLLVFLLFRIKLCSETKTIHHVGCFFCDVATEWVLICRMFCLVGRTTEKQNLSQHQRLNQQFCSATFSCADRQSASQSHLFNLAALFIKCICGLLKQREPNQSQGWFKSLIGTCFMRR